MPEGPEVWTVAKILDQHLKGRKVKETTFYSFCPRYFEDPLRISGRVSSVTARCKKIIFRFRHGSRRKYLVSYLGMTGHWSYEESKYTVMCMVFVDGEKVYYNDKRKFGRLYWCQSREEMEEVFSNCGKDYLTDEISFEEWDGELSKKGKMMISKFLNSPSPFSGIGNYLRADILYHSRVLPDRKINTLTEEERRRIYDSIFLIIQESVDKGGLTISDYQHPNGSMGKYQPLVYGREYDDQGNKVQRKKYDGQTSHYVIEWQK